MSIDLNKTINTMRKLFDMNSELWHQFKAIEEKSPLGKDDPEAVRLLDILPHLRASRLRRGIPR